MEIQTRNGYTILIDECDYELVKEFSWYGVKGKNGNVYAYHSLSQGTMTMHRLILGLSNGDKNITVHVNGNTLDNRRINLTTKRATELQKFRRTLKDMWLKMEHGLIQNRQGVYEHLKRIEERTGETLPQLIEFEIWKGF